MIALVGKPIAITGASSGIGRATALACARAGMPVAVAARRADRLESLVREISAAGGRAIAVACDVDRDSDCVCLIQRTIEAFGSIYAVFANAGYGLEKPIHETSDTELRGIFETNFFGTMKTIRPALPHLLAAGTGHVVVCSSCLSKLAVPGFGAYSATKAAQDHIARAMRAELGGRGIAVSSVHPIGTRTEFFAQVAGSERAPMSLHTPEFFMQRPERVANAIVRRLRKARGGEVWTSAIMRLLFAGAVAFPALTDRMLPIAARDWRKH